VIAKTRRHRARRLAHSVLWLGLTWIGALRPASAELNSGGAVVATAQTQPPQVGNRLFMDDFATESGRWNQSASPKGTAAYQGEVFNVRIVSPGVSLWSLPDFWVERATYYVETTVAVNHASPDSWFGVVVGYASEADFYAFLLSGSGQWRVARRDGGDWVDLAAGDAVLPQIGDGAAPLVLAAALTDDDAGARLTLYVDGAQVGQVPVDGLPAPSGFGVMAQAGRGYVDVTFDDVGAWDVGASG